MFAPSAVIVRLDVAFEQAKKTGTSTDASPTGGGNESGGTGPGRVDEPVVPGQRHRFYGSVEIDMVRPVRSFDSILNAVVMELQRSPNTKVKITLEIEAETPTGFDDADIGVVRDNARQLKFKPESTGFE
jgi:hypothetical protein